MKKNLKIHAWHGVVAAYIAAQIGIVLMGQSPIFQDESIYAVGGRRVVEGFGLSDNYLTWFAGSPFAWPVFNYAGYFVDGLQGIRLMAVAFSVLTLLFVTLASRNLFPERGEKVAFWTALMLGSNGLFFSLGHFGVYDTPAATGLAGTLWAITALKKTDHRIFIGIAALLFSFGVLNKYPVVIMAMVFIALLIVLRGQKAKFDIPIFGFIIMLCLSTYYLAFRAQLVLLFEYQTGREFAGLTKGGIASILLFFEFIPLFLGGIGLFLTPKKGKLLGAILLLSMLLWPLYHVMSSPISMQKHVVFGYLIGFPLVGYAMSKLGELRKAKFIVVPLILIVSLGFNAWHSYSQDQSWPDYGPVNTYMVQNYQPGQQVLADNSWAIAYGLYMGNKVQAPWDIFDQYRLEHDSKKYDRCSADWMIAETYPSGKSFMQKEAEQCGFQAKISVTTEVWGLTDDVRPVYYPVVIVIYEKKTKE